MLHKKSCLIINMPKIMIIKYQQFAKTNTFSLSFHILFSPFLPKTHRNQDLGMGKNGVGPLDPPPYYNEYKSYLRECEAYNVINSLNCDGFDIGSRCLLNLPDLR